jgi:hypothetical protein
VLQFIPSPLVGEGQGGGEQKRIAKRLTSPPFRGDLSRFLWEKNSDAALACGSDRGDSVEMDRDN